MDAFVTAIGRKIRERRTGRGLTLARLAEKTGVSTSLVSQLERGGINPSISLLKAVADALETPLADLLAEEGAAAPRPSPVMRARERKIIGWEGGVRFGLLSRELDLGCEFIFNEWPPGATTGRRAYVHDGVECGVVLQGELEVEMEDGVHPLKPGDSITFRSSTPHRISNRGPKTAKAVWVNSQPWIFSTK